MSSRKLMIAIGSLVALAAGWGLWHWASAPRIPDVRTADLGDVIGFMGTEDYTRLYAAARVDYASGVMDRFTAAMLEKFYQRPARQRKFLLQSIARAVEAERAKHPGAPSRLTPDGFRRELLSSTVRHPPRVQAMLARFHIDLQHQRELLGLPQRS